MSSLFRVIKGGRTDDVTPGLLVVGAAEIATVAGGVRAGEAQGRDRAADRGGSGRPRCARSARRGGLGGADRGGRSAVLGRSGAHGRRPATRSVRPAGRPRWVGHARTRRPAHAPPVRRLPGGRARPAAAWRRLPRDPGRRRRHPRDRRRDPRRDDRRAAGPRPALARRDARPRRDDDRGEVGLRPGPRDRDPAAGRGPSTGSRGPDRHRADVPRRARRPAGVPDAAGWDRGVRPHRDRGAAPGRGRPRPRAVLRRLLRGGRLQRRPVEADPDGGPGLRADAAPARRRAGAIGRRGTRGRAGRGLGRPSGHAVRRGHRGDGRRRGGRTPRRRDAPAGNDVVPHEGPPRTGPGLHRARRARRDRYGLQSRDVAHGQPAAGHDRRLPRPADDAR